MKNKLKIIFTRSLIIFLVILFLILSITIYTAVSYTIPAGECYLNNYTAWDNESNSTYLEQANYCCALQEIGNTTVYLNYTLDSGSRLIGEKENCEFDLYCRGVENITSTSKCERSVNLDNGETYSISDPVCELSFECGEDTECNSELVEQEIIINVVKNNQSITVTSLNQSKTYPLNYTYLSDEFSVNINCPSIPSNEDNETALWGWTYNNCKQWIDFFDERNFIAYDIFAKYLQEGQKDAFSFANGVMIGQEEYREQLITCMSENKEQAVLMQDINTLRGNIRNMEAENNSLKQDRTVLIIVSVILLIILTIFLISKITNGDFQKANEIY